MDIPEKYALMRSSLSVSEISFGAGGLKIFELDELDEQQLGYARNLDGNNLTGDNEGDWKRNWYVIGCDTGVGDPIILDTSDPDLAIFTAPHGEGIWELFPVSPTLEGFFKMFQAFASLAANRSNPVELDEHPVSDKEKEQFLSQVADYNGGNVPFLWKLLLEY